MTELLASGVINQSKVLSNIDLIGIISASTNFSEGRMEEKLI